MKRKLAFFLIFIVGILLLTPQVFARETRLVEVKEGEVVNHDFFGAGEKINISGVINGDAYLAGGEVTIDGRINGDLLVGAGMVILLGEVSDDVRVGAGNVFINGKIGKNLTAGTGNLTVAKEAEIAGSLLVFSGDAAINGSIGKDARVYAGQTYFSNQVGGNLQGEVEQLTLGSGARVAGDLKYRSPQKADMAEGASVSGQIVYQPAKEKTISSSTMFKKIPFVGDKRIRFIFMVLGLLFNFILGLIFISLFPKRTKGILKALGSRPWASLGVGFLTPFVFGLIMLLFLITIIGIPLAVLGILLFGFLLYLSKIFTSVFVGTKLFPNRGYGWALFFGLLVYQFLKIAPFIKNLTVVAFVLFGLGAFVLDQKALRRK